MVVRIPFSEEDVGLSDTISSGYCVYEWKIYPSDEFKSSTEDQSPIIFTVVAACVFVAIAITFFMYDSFVQRRNSKVLDAAAKSNALVLSLFPAQFRGECIQSRYKNLSAASSTCCFQFEFR